MENAGMSGKEEKEEEGRKLIVGMCLTPSCREMLTWTIAKIAQPGDHVLVLHVSTTSISGTIQEQEEKLKQLTSSLCGILSLYQGLCKLKNIKMELEIVKGGKLKHVLVEAACSHRASKLILGTNWHFSICRATALGRYCLKRLPSTCMVVIVENREIILNKKGKLQLLQVSTGSTILSVLQRTIQSLGRSKKVASGGPDDILPDYPRHQSVLVQLTLSGSSKDLASHNGGVQYHVLQQVESISVDRPYSKFSFVELEAATASFSPTNLVGRGGGSEVYRGELQDGKLVAIKCLNQAGLQAEEELLTEIEINTCLSHANIVSLTGYCVEPAHLILVYDFLPEGTLDDHLHGGEKKLLAWEVRYKVAVGMCKALEYLHDGIPQPVIHMDVKASNILLSHDFQPQLSDFGLAKWAPKRPMYIHCNDVVGTFGYLAPEYFMYGRVNDKTDVYSFGVVLLELITGRKPIDTTRPKGEENLVIWARPLLDERNLDKLVDPRLGSTYNVCQMQTMISAASLCVQQSSQRRPQISQVLKMLGEDNNGKEEGLSSLQKHGLGVSMDSDEEEGSHFDGSPNYRDHEADIRTHLALAMLGVDANDDAVSESSIDYSSTDLCSTYLEDYLADRFSSPVSFEDH
ncbi:unnamed protein product [Sphagnum jensenii]|uniref:Protein kinase domain-containing protein n=1 Tax=Sphagnum jensenii TaxID=128206 RepID=A0ABP0VRW5_9BRYO